jgi:endonuclease/exonuclease/phosphatase family metal-dependent hydrolase
MRSLRAAVVTVVLLMLAPLGVAAQAAPPSAPPGKPITAMSRNLYLGADINRPVLAALAVQQAGGNQIQVLTALANATHVTRDIVDDTDFPARSKLLAAEIAETRPDLVGLQEVALWRSGPLELGLAGIPNAQEVDYDFLEILLDDLAALGMEYEAVKVGMRADVESPSFLGSPAAPSGDVRDVRLTMRDVILMRADNALQEVGEGGATYAANLVVEVAGRSMNFTRGYDWVDVRAGTTRFRFVNTHLEAFSSTLALLQAQELLQGTATDRTTVFVCDCNSDPLNSSVKPVDAGPPPVPHKAAYELITGPGGYTDMWLEHAPAEEGWTSGLSETVDDTTEDGWDHRIDMVFAKAADGRVLDVDRGSVTGTDLSDRNAAGLWPSDHGGVVLRLRGL